MLKNTPVSSIPKVPDSQGSHQPPNGVFLPEHHVAILAHQKLDYSSSEVSAPTNVDELAHPGFHSELGEKRFSHERLSLHQCFDAQGNSVLTPRQWAIIALQLIHILDVLRKNNLATPNCLNDLKISHRGHLYLASTSLERANNTYQTGDANVNQGSFDSPQYRMSHEARLMNSAIEADSFNSIHRGVDIWAAGIWLLQLAIGKEAFEMSAVYQFMRDRYSNERLSVREEKLRSLIDNAYQELRAIQKLLPAGEFGEQAWHVLMNLLVFDPKARITGFNLERFVALPVFAGLDHAQPFTGNHLFLPSELIRASDSEAEMRDQIKGLTFCTTPTYDPNVDQFIHKGAPSTYALQWHKEETKAAAGYFLAYHRLRLGSALKQTGSDHFAKSRLPNGNTWNEIIPETLQRLRSRNNIFTVKEWDMLSAHFGLDHEQVIRASLQSYHDGKVPSQKLATLRELLSKLSKHKGQHRILGELHIRVNMELRQTAERLHPIQIATLAADPLVLMDELRKNPDCSFEVPSQPSFAAPTMRHELIFPKLEAKDWRQKSSRAWWRNSIQSVDTAKENYSSQANDKNLQSLLLAILQWMQSDDSKRSSRFDSAMVLLEAVLAKLAKIENPEFVQLNLRKRV